MQLIPASPQAANLQLDLPQRVVDPFVRLQLRQELVHGIGQILHLLGSNAEIGTCTGIGRRGRIRLRISWFQFRRHRLRRRGWRHLRFRRLQDICDKIFDQVEILPHPCDGGVVQGLLPLKHLGEECFELVRNFLDRWQVHGTGGTLQAVCPAKNIRQINPAPARMIESSPNRLKMLAMLRIEGC
jgi:hypothetical protein